ncbi:hypothetical protein GWI33_007749 [Rhynchophorus ferrugineus]|uniref:Uncharacterized protein n=1 Tax=Rhynchophorus ferrugineus TaxID=354439 RepID=A0A834IU55_RHYFE|nr:hypothetical protein GWI33_007749 [Rhynchophorus ferrugineus]
MVIHLRITFVTEGESCFKHPDVQSAKGSIITQSQNSESAEIYLIEPRRKIRQVAFYERRELYLMTNLQHWGFLYIFTECGNILKLSGIFFT